MYPFSLPRYSILSYGYIHPFVYSIVCGYWSWFQCLYIVNFVPINHLEHISPYTCTRASAVYTWKYCDNVSKQSMHMLSVTRKCQIALQGDCVKFIFLLAINQSSLLFIDPHFYKHIFPYFYYFVYRSKEWKWNSMLSYINVYHHDNSLNCTFFHRYIKFLIDLLIWNFLSIVFPIL